MSINKRKLESPVVAAGKKAKLAENCEVSGPSGPPATAAHKPAEKLSKKKEKRKLFKKEVKKKLLKEGKLSRKRKKMDKKSSKTAEITTEVAPPKKPEEISANWKALQQVLQQENGTQIKKNKKKIKKALPVKNDKTKTAPEKPNEIPESKPEMPSKPEIWFELDDENLLEPSAVEEAAANEAAASSGVGVVEPASGGATRVVPTGVTDIVGLDCEMVGVGEGGVDSILARVSIVNQHGHPIYDKYVKPTEPVTDYRTAFSGIRPHNLGKGAVPFKTAQAEVAEILKDRILVGHSLSNDFPVLFLSHHHRKIRDTQKYKPFRKLCGGMPSLKKLAKAVLRVDVQTGEHSSVEDAQTAMRLYMMHRTEWEKELKEKRRKGTATAKKTDD